MLHADDMDQMLGRLNIARREEAGFRDFDFRLPINLTSIRKEDVPAEQQGRRQHGLDIFGVYCSDSAVTGFVEYYIGALDKCGMGYEGVLRGGTMRSSPDMSWRLEPTKKNSVMPESWRDASVRRWKLPHRICSLSRGSGPTLMTISSCHHSRLRTAPRKSTLS